MTIVRSPFAIARRNRHRGRLCAAIARDDPKALSEPELCFFHATDSLSALVEQLADVGVKLLFLDDARVGQSDATAAVDQQRDRKA